MRKIQHRDNSVNELVLYARKIILYVRSRALPTSMGYHGLVTLLENLKKKR